MIKSFNNYLTVFWSKFHHITYSLFFLTSN
nr:MAG TPA: hypothetical protein [Caudoviricetes sp.]